MSPSQFIVLATPVFLLRIAAEWAWGRARGRDTYRLADAVSSIGLGMLSQMSAVFTRLLRVGFYTAVYGWVTLWRNDAFWTCARLAAGAPLRRPLRLRAAPRRA
jgi:hypothetical protein